MIDLEKERNVFEKAAFQASGGWASFEKDSNGHYHSDKLNFGFNMWLKRAEQENAEIDSLKAQLANESKRLDFMLKDNRVVVINTNWNENNERVGEGFCVNNVCWIDGWDRLTSSVHETERGAIDAAMIEEAQENSHDNSN